MRAERAEFVAELLRKHRDRAVHQVDGRAALAGLLVDQRAGTDIPGHVGDVHADLIIAVRERLERQRVVEILCIGRVDGERERVAEILAALQILGRDGVRDLIGGVLHLGREAIGEIELRQDGVHLRVILARLAEHIHHVAPGPRFAALPAVHDRGDLHARLRTHGGRRFGVHLDIVRHRLALHQDPGLGPDGMVKAHEGARGAFENLHDLALAAAVVPALLACHSHAHEIALQGVARLGGLDENVILLTFNDYENKPFAGHLNLADELRKLLRMALAGSLFAERFSAFSTSFLHN